MNMNAMNKYIFEYECQSLLSQIIFKNNFFLNKFTKKSILLIFFISSNDKNFLKSYNGSLLWLKFSLGR